MNEGDIGSVSCPCCNGELYRVGMLAEGVLGMVKGHNSINSDQDGYFIECKHCKNRIAMDSAPTSIGQGFAVSENQSCVLSKL